MFSWGQKSSLITDLESVSQKTSVNKVTVEEQNTIGENRERVLSVVVTMTVIYLFMNTF